MNQMSTKPVSNPDYYRHTEWKSYYDAECSQYQVIDDAKVIATGIETPGDAKLMAAAPDLLRQRDALLCELRGLVEQMDLIGIPQWHGAEGLSLDAARKAIALCEKES